ncbi:MAG: DUF3006 domain-containing protein [Acutalibacteraceae bacterium]
MNVTIDRFEGSFVVVETENGSFYNLPLPLVPTGADEGSVISITLDTAATESRRKEVGRLMDKLFEE